MRRKWRSLRQMFDAAGQRNGRQRVLFFSHGRQDWPHLWPLATALAEDCSAQILYVCATADDPANSTSCKFIHPILLDSPLLCAAYLGTVEVDVCVSTLPDLGTSFWKRSARIARYVYVPHSLVSCHMIYRTGAFDQFDEAFCAGAHHVMELRALEAHRKQPPKYLFEYGYPKLDSLLAASVFSPPKEAPTILLAPSWGSPGLLEMHGKRIIKDMLSSGYRVVVRPHPETMKRSASVLGDLRNQFAANPGVAFDLASESAQSFAEAVLMISDWSGAALEFALGLKRPVIFVDIPRKVNNPDYVALGIEPVEVWARTRMGLVVGASELDVLVDQVRVLLDRSKSNWDHALESLRQELVFNPTDAARLGAARLNEMLRSLEVEKA